MVSKWSQTVPKHIVMHVDPLLAHFGRFPPAFWGSRGLLGVQNGPKIAQKGAKMAQNGQNLEKKIDFQIRLEMH